MSDNPFEDGSSVTLVSTIWFIESCREKQKVALMLVDADL